MTKKKTAKKKTAKAAGFSKNDIIDKALEKSKAKKTVEKFETCDMCEHFRINGEGAKRGRCHRYPTATPTEIHHFCGEFK